jgi:anhydro-N-acetylmuramic acid kinase
MRGSDPCYVGAMSGTSLDGITCAVVRFEEAEERSTIAHELIGFTVHAYTSAQRTRLAAAMQGATPEEYCRLNFDLGEWIASAVQQAIASAGVARSEIQAIGSHGQTLWHVPGHSTWQTGSAAVIAERTGLDVVSDFRARDVAAGGQGAPLVSIADALLYASDDWRLLQNIGGMANVTIVPPQGEVRGIRAFDTGPGVAVIDAIVRTLYPTMTYDVDGAIAARGTPDDVVIRELLSDPYFAQDPPKSTGREHFGDAYAVRLMERCAQRKCSNADVVATAVALTAESMADAYRRFVPQPAEEIVVSGGGANNATLLAAFSRAVGSRRVVPFEDVYYDGEAKEAVAFALLAHLHCMHRPGNVIGATGARAPRVLGVWTPA